MLVSMSSYQHDLSLFLMWTNVMPCFCYHCFNVAILWLEVCFKHILSICHFLVNIDIQCLVFVAFSFNFKLDIFIQHSGNRNGLNFHKYKELWTLHMQYNSTTDTKIIDDIQKCISRALYISNIWRKKNCYIKELVTMPF